MYMDIRTAIVVCENFAGSAHRLWVDDQGNKQLRCLPHDGMEFIEIAPLTLEKLLNEKCDGQKSIALVDMSQQAIVVPVTQLRGRQGVRDCLDRLAVLQSI